MGSSVVLTGANGAGKTTLMRLVATLLRPSSGTGTICGLPLDGGADRIRERVGYLSSRGTLYDDLTAAENLRFATRLMGGHAQDDRIDDLLNGAGLLKARNQRVRTYSTGMRRRLSLTALRLRPLELVLMDEPLGALDKQLREHMQYEIKHIHENLGITVVYVTHDQSEALTMSDRVAVFNDGVIQQLSAPSVLYEEPENAFVAQFIGENNTLMGVVKSVKGKIATVKLDSGDLAEALAVNCGDIGSKTTLSIRPERVLVGGAKAKNTVDAKVIELIYLGDHIRCRMSVHGNDDFIVKVPNSANHTQLQVGETTTVSWKKEDCRALDA